MRKRLMLVFVFVLTLAACSGGDGDAQQDGSTQATEATTTTTTPSLESSTTTTPATSEPSTTTTTTPPPESSTTTTTAPAPPEEPSTTTTTVPSSTTLEVRMTVVNDDGGRAKSESFAVFVFGIEFPIGVALDLPESFYIFEAYQLIGYTATWSGACNENGFVALQTGDAAVCELVYDDMPYTKAEPLPEDPAIDVDLQQLEEFYRGVVENTWVAWGLSFPEEDAFVAVGVVPDDVDERRNMMLQIFSKGEIIGVGFDDVLFFGTMEMQHDAQKVQRLADFFVQPPDDFEFPDIFPGDAVLETGDVIVRVTLLYERQAGSGYLTRVVTESVTTYVIVSAEGVVKYEHNIWILAGADMDQYWIDLGEGS